MKFKKKRNLLKVEVKVLKIHILNQFQNQISKSKKDSNNNPRVIRLRGGGNGDEEYIPTQQELDEAQEEEKPLVKKAGICRNFFSNKRNSYQRPTEPPFTEIYEGALMRPNKKVGKELYEGAHVVHTLVRVFDVEKDVFIESYCEDDENSPLNGHNIVNIFDAKELDYKLYHPVEGSKDSLNLTVDQLYNKIKNDQGSYDPIKNNCITTSKEILTYAENNKGINIINDMMLDENKVNEDMKKYYDKHPIRKWYIQKYLEK